MTWKCKIESFTKAKADTYLALKTKFVGVVNRRLIVFGVIGIIICRFYYNELFSFLVLIKCIFVTKNRGLERGWL